MHVFSEFFCKCTPPFGWPYHCIKKIYAFRFCYQPKQIFITIWILYVQKLLSFYIYRWWTIKMDNNFWNNQYITLHSLACLHSCEAGLGAGQHCWSWGWAGGCSLEPGIKRTLYWEIYICIYREKRQSEREQTRGIGITELKCMYACSNTNEV